MLRQIKALGICIAMTISAPAIRHCPPCGVSVDRIKDDGFFIKSVNSNGQAATIVRRYWSWSRTWLTRARDGVETDAELQFLHDELCDEGAGYLLGRPAAIAAPQPHACGCRNRTRRRSSLRAARAPKPGPRYPIALLREHSRWRARSRFSCADVPMSPAANPWSWRWGRYETVVRALALEAARRSGAIKLSFMERAGRGMTGRAGCG